MFGLRTVGLTDMKSQILLGCIQVCGDLTSVSDANTHCTFLCRKDFLFHFVQFGPLLVHVALFWVINAAILSLFSAHSVDDGTCM